MMKLNQEQISQIKNTKSIEELKELCINSNISIEDNELEKLYQTYHDSGYELSDEELDNVTGGCTTYSDGVEAPNGVVRKYVIVTDINFCPAPISVGCGNCFYSFRISPTKYCRLRWEGHDTVAQYGDPRIIKTSSINPEYVSNSECTDKSGWYTFVDD